MSFENIIGTIFKIITKILVLIFIVFILFHSGFFFLAFILQTETCRSLQRIAAKTTSIRVGNTDLCIDKRQTRFGFCSLYYSYYRSEQYISILDAHIIGYKNFEEYDVFVAVFNITIPPDYEEALRFYFINEKEKEFPSCFVTEEEVSKYLFLKDIEFTSMSWIPLYYSDMDSNVISTRFSEEEVIEHDEAVKYQMSDMNFAITPEMLENRTRFCDRWNNLVERDYIEGD